MKPFRTAPVAAALALLAAGPALAHAKLVNATPAVDSAVSGAPSEIRIDFSEAILPKFSGVALTDAAGRKVPTGPSATAPGDAKQMIVPITGKLAAGVYTVTWHSVSADTHRVTGKYNFTVK